MVIKTQPIAPLETIYEESHSFISSVGDTQHLDNDNTQSDRTVSGLISARSVPSVHSQRQKISENSPKPPVEVQYRDGSKRFIHSLVPIRKNEKKSSSSTQENFSQKKLSNSKHRQIFDSNFNNNNNKPVSKPPLVITIISAEDIRQANLSPLISSSPSESEISTSSRPNSTSTNTKSTSTNTKSTSTYTASSSSSEKITTNDKPSKIPVKVSPLALIQQPQQVVNDYTPTHQSPRTISQNSHSRQTPNISHGHSTPSQISNVSSQGRINENERAVSSQFTVMHNYPNNPPIQLNTIGSVGGGGRSAFRPVLKPVHINQQPLSFAPQVPLTVNGTSYHPPQPPPPQQQQQIVPYVQPTFSQSKALVPTSQYNSRTTEITHTKSLIPSNATTYYSNYPHVLNISTNPNETLSLAVNSNLHWFNVTSNSLRDIPRIATAYSGIPVHITIPVRTPTHNQKLVLKHDFALESRLLNAGLSPETVALYERILDIAEHGRLSVLSPPNIIDRYIPYKS